MRDQDLVEFDATAAHCQFGECTTLAHRTIRRWRKTWGPYCDTHILQTEWAMDQFGRALIDPQETTA